MRVHGEERVARGNEGNHGEQTDHADGGRPPGDVVHLEPDDDVRQRRADAGPQVPSHILRYGMQTPSGVRPIYRRGSRPFPVSSLTPIMDVMSVRLKGLLRGLAELLPSKGLRPPLLCQRPVAW